MGYPSAFTAEVRALLHPHPYTYEAEVLGTNLGLLLHHGSALGGRYALAVIPWADGLDGPAQLLAARDGVRRALRAWFPFRQVGVYLIFLGPEDAWRPDAAIFRADRTGLHHVIVQGVHLVDPETGARQFDQSAWGKLKFGGLQGVAELIETIRVA